MKKLVSLFLTLCVLLSLALPALGESIPATFLYVATDGNDSNAGTIDAPFQTLQAAINASRAIDGTVVINMRGGTYQVTETITLTEEDHDLVIRAYQDEDVVLTGGTELSLADFKPCEDAAFLDALVDQSVRENIICANILEQGVTELGEIKACDITEGAPFVRDFSPMLSFGDTELTLARYPNDEYIAIPQDSTVSEGQNMRFLVEGHSDHLTKWQWDDVWSAAYSELGYIFSRVPAEFDPSSERVSINVLSGSLTSLVGLDTSIRTYFFNVPEELDRPGEYYVDRSTGMLYLFPTEEMTSEGTLMYSSTTNDLISASKAKNVVFQGLSLMGTTEIGFLADGCDGIVLNDCEISMIGRAAVKFTDCYRSGVTNSYLHDLGASGVIFSDCGDRITLTSSECFVTNSHIERFSQYVKVYAPAVEPTNVVGITVSHCKFNDAPHCAIVARYNNPINDVIVEYNEFYDVCNEAGDCAAIYYGWRWDSAGNVISNNYFHDIFPTELDFSSGLTACVYLDEGMSGVTIDSNVFYHTVRILHNNGGRSNVFTNNILLDNFCDGCVTSNDLGVTPAWHNVTFDPSTSYYLPKTLEGLPYQTGIWAEKYPYLVNIVEDQVNFPKYNVVMNNISWKNEHAIQLSVGVKMFGTVKNNFDLSSTECFVDYDNQDFTLKEDSEVFTLIPDFEPIPFNEIGLYDYTVEDVYEEVQ